MGIWAAGAGVPAVRGDGDDAEAGGAGAVDVLVSGVPAVGSGGGAECDGSGGRERGVEAKEGRVLTKLPIW